MSTPGEVTEGAQISYLGRSVTFGLEAMGDPSGRQGECTVLDQTAGVQIMCTTVTALVVNPTHATLFGTGTLNGQPITCRIDVDDLGESGTGHDTLKIQTDGGYVAGGVLTQGNIQIHLP